MMRIYLFVFLLIIISCSNVVEESSTRFEYDFYLNYDNAQIETENSKYVNIELVEILNEPKWSIFLHPKSELTFQNIAIGKDARLLFEYGLKQEIWRNSGDGVGFNIYVENNNDKIKVFENYIDPKNKLEDQKWHSGSIDLSNFELSNATISFETVGGNDKQKVDYDSDWAVIANPKIESNGFQAKQKGHGKTNVIFISIDTLRADYLESKSNKWMSAPNIDELASNGVRFENCFSPSSTTSPSHVSFLTSLLPYYHGVIGNDYSVARKLPTLQQIFKEEGYKTGAAVSVMHLKKNRVGLDSWFDKYYEPRANNADNLATLTMPGSSVASAGIEMMDEFINDPFFIWLHFYDPHVPYIAVDGFHRMFFDGDPHKIKSLEYINASFSDLWSDAWLNGIQDINYCKKEYGAEIAYVDFQIGRIVDALDKKKLKENTLLVLTSDHGENLGEHDIFFDHWGLHNTDLHVPLIINFPNSIPKGKVVVDDCSGIDIAPTILEITGNKDNYLAEKTFKGHSLLPNIKFGAKSERMITANALYYLQITSFDSRYKAIWEVRDATYSDKVKLQKDTVHIYDRIEDPDELDPIAEFVWYDEGERPVDYEQRVERIANMEKPHKFKIQLELIRDIAGQKPVPDIKEMKNRFKSDDRYSMKSMLLDDNEFYVSLNRLMNEMIQKIDPPNAKELLKDIYDLSSFENLEINSMQINDPEFQAQLKALGYTQN